MFCSISLKFHINWCHLASVSSFFVVFVFYMFLYLLIVLHNHKLVVFISIRVFFVVLFFVIVPDQMVACKIV